MANNKVFKPLFKNDEIKSVCYEFQKSYQGVKNFPLNAYDKEGRKIRMLEDSVGKVKIAYDPGIIYDLVPEEKLYEKDLATEAFEEMIMLDEKAGINKTLVKNKFQTKENEPTEYTVEEFIHDTYQDGTSKTSVRAVKLKPEEMDTYLKEIFRRNENKS